MSAALRSRPLVSVGVPVYNGENFLAQQLDSLLAQTYRNVELIVSDNGSTDATEEICREYARADERVAYHRHDRNRGAAWNYNFALARARGAFFKWACHDDVHLPRYVEACLDALEHAGTDVVFSYARSKVIDEQGEVLWEHYDGLDLVEDSASQRLRRLVANPPNMGTSFFGVARTGVLRSTRGHGAFISADYVVLAELALRGKLVEVPEFLFLKRYHPGMSREANDTLAEVADWFEPGSGRGIVLEYWPLFLQHLVSIARAPLPAEERLRCFGVFVPGWFRVWRRFMTGEACFLGRELVRAGLARRHA
jgi:glycosyltransferase involved in cell wall biosynthesis